MLDDRVPLRVLRVVGMLSLLIRSTEAMSEPKRAACVSNLT